jgi:hypothetical protein
MAARSSMTRAEAEDVSIRSDDDDVVTVVTVATAPDLLAGTCALKTLWRRRASCHCAARTSGNTKGERAMRATKFPSDNGL